MESRALILATILRVKDGHFIFPFCNVCYCKVTMVTAKGSLQRFACSKCRQSFDVSQLCYRYRLSATISDGSVACDVSIFGKCLEIIFGTEPARFNRLLQRYLNPKHSNEESRDEALHKMMTGSIVGKQFYFGFKIPSKKQTLSTLKQVLQLKIPHQSASNSGIPDGLVAFQIFTHTLGPLKPSLAEILQRQYAPENHVLCKDNQVSQNEQTGQNTVVCDRHTGNGAMRQDCVVIGNSTQSPETVRSQQTMNLTDTSHEFTSFASSSDFSLGMTSLEVTCDARSSDKSLRFSVECSSNHTNHDLSSQQLAQSHLVNESCVFNDETQQNLCNNTDIYPTKLSNKSNSRQHVIGHKNLTNVRSVFKTNPQVPKLSIVCNLPSPILNKSVHFLSSRCKDSKETDGDNSGQRSSCKLLDVTPAAEDSVVTSEQRSSHCKDTKETDRDNSGQRSSCKLQDVTPAAEDSVVTSEQRSEKSATEDSAMTSEQRSEKISTEGKDGTHFRTNSDNFDNVTSGVGDGSAIVSTTLDTLSHPSSGTSSKLSVIPNNSYLPNRASNISQESDSCSAAESMPCNQQSFDFDVSWRDEAIPKPKTKLVNVGGNCIQSSIDDESGSQELGAEQSGSVVVMEPDVSSYFDGADLPLSEDLELFLQKIEAQYADQVKDGGKRRTSCKKLKSAQEETSLISYEPDAEGENLKVHTDVYNHQPHCKHDSEVSLRKMTQDESDKNLNGCYGDSIPSDTSAFSYTGSQTSALSALSYTGSQELFSQSYIDCQVYENHSTPHHVLERSKHAADIQSKTKSMLIENTTSHCILDVDRSKNIADIGKEANSILIRTASHSTPLVVVDQNKYVANTRRERSSMLMKSAFGTPLLFSQDVISPVENHSRSHHNFLTSKSNSRRVSRRHRVVEAPLATRLHQLRHISPYVIKKREIPSLNAGLQNLTQQDDTSYKSYTQNGTSTPDLFLDDDDESYPNMCNKISYQDSPDLFSPTQHTSLHQDLNRCNDKVDLRKKLF
ncbi:uncharacterized protein [Amphiura filiformis]|uniref:uncharacterized protein n=1 Tax=Amphiura filiformis TaxID=82378 RepID=UPI003B224366